MAMHSSILAWENPWTEEPGGLQSLGSQRIRHDLATNNNNKTENLRGGSGICIFYKLLRWFQKRWS